MPFTAKTTSLDRSTASFHPNPSEGNLHHAVKHASIASSSITIHLSAWTAQKAQPSEKWSPRKHTVIFKQRICSTAARMPHEFCGQGLDQSSSQSPLCACAHTNNYERKHPRTLAAQSWLVSHTPHVYNARLQHVLTIPSSQTVWPKFFHSDNTSH